jgi:hypothetical protein
LKTNPGVTLSRYRSPRRRGGHTGDNPGFKAFVLASVPRRSGWILFMNGDNARPLLQEFLDAKSPLNDLFKS